MGLPSRLYVRRHSNAEPNDQSEVAMESPPTTAPAIPIVTVTIPAALRERTGGRLSVQIAGSTVREVVAALESEYPGLAFNLCYETGELRPYVNVFVNAENVRYLQGLDTPVAAGATIRVLQSVAGG